MLSTKYELPWIIIITCHKGCVHPLDNHQKLESGFNGYPEGGPILKIWYIVLKE